LRAPASEAFRIVFHNDDPGIPHNVAIYTDSSAKQALFVGKIFSGPAILHYQVPALPAGTYFFRCDVHHNMTGTFEVTASSPSPSPST